ncbi:Clusterin-associated protein 1 [Podochytrium sp. JEL0797]|nr:Clusterin-associated protein 1 [Podochytrium sp. JEL0797]
MSFRELRSFTEKMRALGYPRMISMDSFRLCNFDAVADILLWLVKNYDPSFDVMDDIESEQDRVIFIKTIATFMASKANIRLNTRKLYTADGYAVKELNKIASVLYEASRIHQRDDIDQNLQPPLSLTPHLPTLKSIHPLSTQITSLGAHLHTSLSTELTLRQTRLLVLARPFDLAHMHDAVSGAVEALKRQIGETREAGEGLEADEVNLGVKIEKRRVELERAEKRLKSLQGVRPAYMDEYEKIEVDLVKLYEIYMDKFRNLAYLEQQLDEHDRIEQDKFEETEQSLKKMQTRLREEEMQLLRGDKEIHDSVTGGSSTKRPNRPHAAGRRGGDKKSGGRKGIEDSDSDGMDGERGEGEEEDDSNDDDDDDAHLSSSDPSETSEGETDQEPTTARKDLKSRTRPGEGNSGRSGGGGGLIGSGQKTRNLEASSEDKLIDRREGEDGGSESDDSESGVKGGGGAGLGDEMDESEEEESDGQSENDF